MSNLNLQAICQLVIFLFWLKALGTCLYWCVNGDPPKPAKEAGGFSGFLATAIIFSALLWIQYTAGTYSLLAEWITK